MTRTALALYYKARCFARKNAPTKRSINQLTSRDGTLRRVGESGDVVAIQAKSGRSADNQFR